MTTLEEQLRSLHAAPPRELEEATLVATGAADQVVLTDSPIGAVWVAWSRRGVTGVTPRFAAGDIEAFMGHHRRRSYAAKRLPSDLADIVTEGLETGDTSGVPVDLSGVAAFQRSVLLSCSSIPLGSVRPYGWIATDIGNPGSVRAVGTALGRNPIPLIIPCHRVVRSDGSIGEYAFGPDMKRQLLVREGAILA
jgi:methylated-DNA-[protein]-cysteine S-methyltransferase